MANGNVTRCGYCGRVSLEGTGVCPECGTGLSAVESEGTRGADPLVASAWAMEAASRLLARYQKAGGVALLAIALACVLFFTVGRFFVVKSSDERLWMAERAMGILIEGERKFKWRVCDALGL